MVEWKERMNDFVVGLADNLTTNTIFEEMTNETRIRYFCKKLKERLIEVAELDEREH